MPWLPRFFIPNEGGFIKIKKMNQKECGEVN
jgi:hypothetical protein